MYSVDAADRLRYLTGEIENFEDIARYLPHRATSQQNVSICAAARWR
jgi:hypothetical protein